MNFSVIKCHLLLIAFLLLISSPLKLASNDQNATQPSDRSGDLKDQKPAKKSSSLNCFNCFNCSKFRRKRDEIAVNPELFDDQTMSNPFKAANSRGEDNQSTSSSLSPVQLVIKPIKSLSSNATGSGRNKVELQPGHSLMDWIRLTSSGKKDLTCGGAGQRRVTGAELAKHDRLEDAWTSIQGNVFNITEYMQFHPGGVDELMRAAGRESTQLFKQVHAWVNWASLLGKCKVGHLVPGDDVLYAELDKEEPEKQEGGGSSAAEKDTAASAEQFVDTNFIVLNETESLYQINVNNRFNLDAPVNQLPGNRTPGNSLLATYWIDDLRLFDLFFQFEQAISADDLMVDISEERRLKVKIHLPNASFYSLNCRLPSKVQPKFEHGLQEAGKLLKLTLTKFEDELWAGQINRDNYRFELAKQSIPNAFFRKVKLVEKRSLTHDVYLFAFQMPEGLHIRCAFGNHVALRLAGKPEFRYYTVVPQCFLNENDQTTGCYEDKDRFYFIIKIYKDGEFTSKLGEVKVGETVEMSDVFSIDFDIKRALADRSTIYLLAAGTGITPMLSVLFLGKLLGAQQTTKDKQATKEIKLLFCNKTEQDIILREQLDRLADRWPGVKFSYVNVLSRPAANWTGAKGRVNEQLFREHFSFDRGQFLFLCGPDAFNLSALQLLDSLYKLKDDAYFVFSS